MKRLLPMILICLWFVSVIPAAADVTVGLPPDPATGSCWPFGCAFTGEYQQVYTHSQFPGPITVKDLEFFNTQSIPGLDPPTSMNSGNWTISLSTTSADWNTLSITLSSNIGADNTVVFSGDLFQPWALGDTLHINLTTPFTYDPANGNLLMDVVATDTSMPGGFVFFDINGYNNGNLNGNTIMGRVSEIGGIVFGLDSGFGLVTGFSTSVPEPSTLLLLGAGLAGVGILRRRFRK